MTRSAELADSGAQENVTRQSGSEDQSWRDVLNREFLFIIGSDRSGTTWLQSMIAAHPQVATTVQLTLFHTYVPDWIRSWNMEVGYIEDADQWDMGLPVVWSEQEFHEFLREFVAKAYSKVAEKSPNASHILDKHPAYREHVEDINLLLPNAKFIHVIRDGRDVALSLIAAKKGLGWGFSSVREAAEAWARFVRRGQEATKYGERYVEVRYEDLKTDGVATLQSVFEFCGLAASEEEVGRILEDHQFERMKRNRQTPDATRNAPAAHYRKGASGQWKEGYSAVQRGEFHQIAGGLLCELGYAEPGWWYQSRIEWMFVKAVLLAKSGLSVVRKLISWVGRTVLG
ncbi:sulfotransferase [Blastopirellula sp. JC732]|uniref:Sulfotransferase n=1 Tax=Blastopirellula sediminis TaxID=2894196 RepID=A0A9X1SF58_9BACT|nr:sulfotransferase [Blastopirellula sediminis]MCC9608443.1 sulfotransferase [Blastopirellula sediminis]MCC9628780.1 sulfotransferase [Blastopirellula sediminis]